MHLLYIVLLFLATVVLIILDLTKKINLLHPLPLTLCLIAVPNGILWIYWGYNAALSDIHVGWRVGYLLAVGLFFLYIWLLLSIHPVRDEHKLGVRLKIMIDGRFITYTALWSMLVQLVFALVAYRCFLAAGVPGAILIANTVFWAVAVFMLIWNGILRMFFTSRRLSVAYRVVMALTMWIPLVNLFVLAWACRLVYEEYDFAINKADLREIRAGSDLCKTKYPLVMVHGVLFRDLKYFNYWGRVPKELARYGATIYYGNQEAVGTIATNGEDIRDQIFKVMKETGCEKVNIIAHSKGGLDARYTVSALGMEDYVASLTTMNSPHRGCSFVDKAVKMPQGLYRFIAKTVDNTFRKFGDANPDFYTATQQFTTSYSEEFNQKTPDSPKVYYQSYMSKMNNMFSDTLLGIPYAIIKGVSGENDGLVTLDSAPWGRFRQLFTVPGRRGISHGDIIDLKREDIKGFDVVETYVNIVADLKKMGY